MSLCVNHSGDVDFHHCPFDKQRFDRRLKTDEPAIVHVASHAVFTGNLSTSFVLSHDEKIGFEELEYHKIILRIAAETGLNSARMLLPMSYAALISGMLTLIATPPNLVVTEELQSAGYAGFGFFSFSPVGLAVLAVAIVYVLVVGRRLLAADTGPSTSARQPRRIEQIRPLF